MFFQSLKATHTIKDDTGKSIQSIKIFALTLRFLKGHLLNALRMRGRDISTEDIKWLVTVPTMWNDVCKQFVRQAAVQVRHQTPYQLLFTVLKRSRDVLLCTKKETSGVLFIQYNMDVATFSRSMPLGRSDF